MALDARSRLRSLARWALALGAPLAAYALRLSSRRCGVALVYHAVAPEPGRTDRELVPAHSESLFEAQVRLLVRRFRVVPAGQLLQAAAARRRGGRFPVAITFDDDLPTHVRHALPVLRRAGAPATFFLSGASLERPFAFWWERLQRAADERPGEAPALVAAPPSETLHELGARVEAMVPQERDEVARRLGELVGPDPEDAGLRAADVRTLADAGMEIGFHTLRHDPLPALRDDALAAALRDGRDRLERLAGAPLTVVAYPHGRGDARVATAARAAGFEAGYTGAARPVRPGDDPLLLGRVTPSYRSARRLALQVVRMLLR